MHLDQYSYFRACRVYNNLMNGPAGNGANASFDLVIIGAGSGGLAAAEVAASLGARVGLVEANERLGGECLHAGCVPSKAFIHGAKQFQAAQPYLSGDIFDQAAHAFGDTMTHVKASIDQVERQHDNKQYYEQRGVTVMNGRACFSGPHTIEVEGAGNINAGFFVIATGSRPLVPDIPGLREAAYLTNETFFDLKTLPRRLAVIGGGPIGCELGQAIALFGSEVSIVTTDERLLPREEPEASQAVQAAFAALPNMKVITNASIKQCAKAAADIRLSLQDGPDIICDQVLVATGRMANSELSLDAAGVATGKHGIITVNDHFQTSQAHIYAIGDVSGGPNFTHVAVDQAARAVQHALLGLGPKRRSNNELIWATFTSPEVARLGLDEQTLIKNRQAYQVDKLDFADVDKAVADGTAGFVKVLSAPNGRLLGVTIVGGPASELIGMFAIAKRANMTLDGMSQALQVYPTLSFGVQYMTSTKRLADNQTGLKKKMLTLLRALRS